MLLFGGGFALAEGFQVSGLADTDRQQVRLAGRLASPLLMVGLICLTLTFLTEVTSNTATTQMILPILASLAVDMQVNPLLLMIPATLSASCAFMMPIATPPNAIVFGSGRIRIPEMARIGVFINLVGVVADRHPCSTPWARWFSASTWADPDTKSPGPKPGACDTGPYQPGLFINTAAAAGVDDRKQLGGEPDVADAALVRRSYHPHRPEVIHPRR